MRSSIRRQPRVSSKSGVQPQMWNLSQPVCHRSDIRRVQKCKRHRFSRTSRSEASPRPTARPLKQVAVMAPALALWNAVTDAYGLYGSTFAVLLAASLLAGGAIAIVATAQYLRRVVRHRRVARELARVHEAAYRERFGHRGRFA
jgi:hypothetical protein